MAHNHEVTGSKPVAGIYHSGGFIRTRHAVTTATLHRYGAEGARVAHNHEDTGSKPVAGIYHSGGLSEHANAVTTATLHPFSSAAEHPGS